jgi:hypothetical protein
MRAAGRSSMTASVSCARAICGGAPISGRSIGRGSCYSSTCSSPASRSRSARVRGNGGAVLIAGAGLRAGVLEAVP